VSRGYRNYRGRSSRLKILAAVLLCLVILAAVTVILLQEHIFFDENGVPHLEVPWRESETAPPENPDELDLVIRKPQAPPELRARLLEAAPLTLEALEGLEEDAGVTMKAGDQVYFDSRTALTGTVETAGDTEAALAALTERTGSVAVLSCLRDAVAARGDAAGMGLETTSGYLFYDSANLNWLDPSKEAVQAYLSGFVRELAELGFREILLTDVTFPTGGRLDQIAYPEEGAAESLTALLKALRTELDQNGFGEVHLTLEVPAQVILQGQDEAAGLALAELAPAVDRLCAETTEEEAAALDALVTEAGGRFVPVLDHVPEGLRTYLVR